MCTRLHALFGDVASTGRMEKAIAEFVNGAAALRHEVVDIASFCIQLLTCLLMLYTMMLASSMQKPC